MEICYLKFILLIFVNLDDLSRKNGLTYKYRGDFVNTYFSKAVFSFYIYEKKSCVAETSQGFEKMQTIGNYIFCHDSRTPVDYYKNENRELLIYGYAVDVVSGQEDELSKKALESTSNISDVIEFESKLGGKYIVLYAENGRLYCIGDATCSVPIYYTLGMEKIICCSNPQLLIEKFQLKHDNLLVKIRKSGNLNQAMPFDVTPYKEIKQLIPNHYFDFYSQKSVRFINYTDEQKEVTPEDTAKKTASMIDKITQMYYNKFEICCPLTAGRDSRVVLAFLKNAAGNDKLISYTVWQEKFKKDSQDWDVPMELSELAEIEHQRIYLDEITENARNEADGMLGKNAYPDDAFRLALTLENHYPNKAIIEGDIMGQVGKCSLHRDIPLSFATPGYFRCKLHNYSKEAKILLEEWLKEIKLSGEKVNVFDLFSVENRLGRWSAQTHIIHNTMGRIYVNIFNSRSIIYTWTAVDRALRKNSEIHCKLIKHRAPELLSIPFEQDTSSIISFAKSNAIVFYFASYLKFFIQRIIYKIKNNSRL